MIIRYIVEVWNPIIKKYQVIYECNNIHMAEKILKKSYYRIHTLRLIKIQEEILYTIKKERK